MNKAHEPLEIGSLDALVDAEDEILRRVLAREHGERLLLLDPVRLLSEVGVRLSDEAIAAWDDKVHGDLLAPSGNAAAYDAVADSDPEAHPVAIRFKSLFGGRR